MSLLGALTTGSTGLAVQQALIQVTGNNIANAGNANYSRETATIEPGTSQEVSAGVFLGTGVELTGVQREVDDSLNDRLRQSVSDASAASNQETWISQVQQAVGALSGEDFSTESTSFFNAWSTLANSPTDSGDRQVVIQDGQNLAGYLNTLNGQLNDLKSNVDSDLPQEANIANGLASQIANLNVQISVAEGGGQGQASDLRDQRDAALSSLSQLVNVTTQTQPNGSITVYVGSIPLVDGQTNNGLSVANKQDSTGAVEPTLVFTNTGGTVDATSGKLGSINNVKSQINDTISQVNTLAHSLINQVNQLSSSGQGTKGFSSVTSTNAVDSNTAALDSTAAGLQFTPESGSFVVHVNQASGTTASTLVQVNLNGAPSDTSLNSLAATLNGISGVSASIQGGKLTVKSSDSTANITFSQDSSGTLSALGINTFFTGSGSGDISVNPTLTNDADLLATAQNGEAGDNSNAVAISKLSTADSSDLDGSSLSSSYQSLVNEIANSAASATTNATAAQSVQDTLTAQQQSLSGVSIDEETVNLLQQQQAFAAAAKVVSTVNLMYTTLMDMF